MILIANLLAGVDVNQTVLNPKAITLAMPARGFQPLIEVTGCISLRLAHKLFSLVPWRQ
jgi:hypothetical protein